MITIHISPETLREIADDLEVGNSHRRTIIADDGEQIDIFYGTEA